MVLCASRFATVSLRQQALPHALKSRSRRAGAGAAGRSTGISASRSSLPPRLTPTLRQFYKLAGETPAVQACRTESAFTLFPSTGVCGRQTITLPCYEQDNIYIAFKCEENEPRSAAARH